MYLVSTSNLHQQNFTWKDQLTSPHYITKIVSKLCLYLSHINTWFHWNSSPYTQSSTPGWLKGFPAANGKWMAIVFACVCVGMCVCVCVLWPQHSHVTIALSPAHQWGYTSCLRSARPSPWCHRQWNEKRRLRKGNKKWLLFIVQLRKKRKILSLMTSYCF